MIDKQKLIEKMCETYWGIGRKKYAELDEGFKNEMRSGMKDVLTVINAENLPPGRATLFSSEVAVDDSEGTEQRSVSDDSGLLPVVDSLEIEMQRWNKGTHKAQDFMINNYDDIRKLIEFVRAQPQTSSSVFATKERSSGTSKLAPSSDMVMVPKEQTDAMLAELKNDADNAYCRYITIVDEKCRGTDYHLDNKTFSALMLDAHKSANEQLGFHRGVHHALRQMAAQTDKGG